MATRKIPDETSEDGATMSTAGDEIEGDDFSFSSSADDKPKTAQELYRALVANGFIGAWKDRTDIGIGWNLPAYGANGQTNACAASKCACSTRILSSTSREDVRPLQPGLCH
jgi:hypothetical protein